MSKLAIAAFVSLLLGFPLHGSFAMASAQRQAYTPEDYLVGAWWLYKSVFVEGGRVIDRSNGNVSHSESQGYGMLIAVTLDDREAFDKIWSWTRSELFIRNDDLAAWKWDPSQTPHVADKNNASDGDILIAWALLRAAERWHEPEYKTRAARILDALADAVVIEQPGYGTILLPAADGFDAKAQADGPIVNLSYWVFPALKELQRIETRFPAEKLLETGIALMSAARFGEARLPADWISLSRETPVPAANFAAVFGFEAIRLPLYATWYGAAEKMVAVHEKWQIDTTAPLQVIELSTGVGLVTMADAGYRAVDDLLACGLGRVPQSSQFLSFKPEEYYASTIQLLSMIVLSERYSKCIPSLN